MKWFRILILAALMLVPSASADHFHSAFGEALTVEPTPRIQLTFPYNINADLVTTTVANGGTVTVASGNAVLQTSADAAGSAVLESVRVLRYGTGQGGLVRFTSIFSPCTASSMQIIGLGDADDGYFIGCNGEEFGILRRAGGVDYWTKKADWVPPLQITEMGGTMKYSPYHDIEKGNVWQIQYQWLGYGQISFGVEDPTLGAFRKFHVINYADAHTTPSIENPTLPMRVEVTNSGNASNLTFKTASLSASIEGRDPGLFVTRSMSNTVTSSATEIPIFSIRVRSTFAGMTNRVESMLSHAVVEIDGGNTHRFRILRNPILTGAVYADVETDRSTMEVDTTATAVSGGDELMSLLIPGDSFHGFTTTDMGIDMRAGDIITVTAERISGASVVVGGSLQWREQF